MAILALPDEKATRALAAVIADALAPNSVLFLHGELGVGKTAFVKGLVSALGCDDSVLSPSFPIMHSYATTKGELLHLDLYRLDEGCDFYALGLLDKIDHVMWAVEWPEKGAEHWLSPDLSLRFSFGEGLRQVELIAHSEASENLLQVVQDRGFIK